MTNQVISGKALEYGIAFKFSELLNGQLQKDKVFYKAEESFYKSNEQNKILNASAEAILFLMAHDNNLSLNYKNFIIIQSDKKGQKGKEKPSNFFY
jgi:hypothetical protein